MRLKDSIIRELSGVRAWSQTGADGKTISLLDYVCFTATPDMFFGFAALFYPELITHEGRRFLASGFTVAAYDAWAQQGRTANEIQRVLNHLHVSTLIQNQELSDEVAVEIARVVAHIWARTLGPEGLVVEALGSTFVDAAVTFFAPADQND